MTLTEIFQWKRAEPGLGLQRQTLMAGWTVSSREEPPVVCSAVVQWEEGELGFDIQFQSVCSMFMFQLEIPGFVVRDCVVSSV